LEEGNKPFFLLFRKRRNALFTETGKIRIPYEGVQFSIGFCLL
jgi:hypothetical protein